MLVAAMLLGACAADQTDAPVLSERAYLAWVTRDCRAARQLVAHAGSAGAAPAIYLRRVAAGAQALQRDFAALRPPARLEVIHRELIAVGDAQLALIGAALERVERGEVPQAAVELEARNRELVRRANALAEDLGLAACVNEPGPP